MNNLDKLIHNKLNEIYSSDNYIIKNENEFSSSHEYTEYRKLIFVILLNDLKVINNKFGQDDSISLNEKGRKICSDGGWFKYLKEQKEESRKEKQKLEYDLKISKLKSKTFFPALILGLIGGIYSIIKIITLLLKTLNQA